MIRFTQKEWRIFRHLQKKHNVSMEFLRYNLNNIQKIIWYETWPRIIIKRYAVRKRNRVYLAHYRLRRVLFDHSNRNIFLRMRQNIRQWSKRMVAYNRRSIGTEEYVEEIVCEKKNAIENADDVSKQMKKQLELLKSARRQQPLIKATTATEKTSEQHQQEGNQSPLVADNVAGNAITNQQKSDNNLENIRSIIQDSLRENKEAEELPQKDRNTLGTSYHSTTNSSAGKLNEDWQNQLESTPEKQVVVQENVQPFKQLATDEKTEKSQNEDDQQLTTSCQKPTEKVVKTGLNFLDMLMCKVTAKQTDSYTKADNSSKPASKTSSEVVYNHEHSLDSADEFLGFEDAERVPGMLMTPIVPFSIRGNKNSAFVSETLNEYMRANDLETDYNIDDDKAITRLKIAHTDLEGLVTPKTQPPPFDMPAVPDNLLKFRTVAERKNYLQKCSKNHRLSIINNEASIYRELQKRIRYQKTKHTSQLLAQSANSTMSFTRNGWHVASFINTEFNKYHYQMIDVDRGKYQVRLKGVRGNNDKFRKKPYISFVKKPRSICPRNCVDQNMWQDFKPIQTFSPKTKKLNKEPLASVFKPCPLSHKALQKPLDDDAAALLLAGGSMAVVRMPTVELEVFPENGRPLSEIAKRYLQYILPHHDISREWAEFSVSTLKLPGSLKEAVQAAAESIPRKSFTFLIPYLNDRNHVLVRRVVDRSEKLDQSFENCLETELVPKTDFTFRQNLDQSDEILLACADVVSDMINTVAISCSENSFIKNDPDMLSEDKAESLQLSPINKVGRPPSSASNSGPTTKKPTKQKRVLLELKRLNATIIDAAVKSEEDKTPCPKEYCAMGCICNSLTEETRLREHCGKAKCILECSCKGSNPSRIMRLETDGRTITTEDAFMLRRKATARLARMEKEFTSTVVLTENETLLINETNNDKKRRCTKVPKRYECDDDSDEEPRRTSPKKTALTTIDNEKNLAVEVKEIREPVYIEDTILDQMKHCTVNVVKLQDIDNVAPWCMVHHLYKCFCKGRALDGKPMIIEKGENNTTIEHVEDEPHFEVDYKSNAKARYTFEKVEKTKKDRDEEEHSDDDVNAANYGHSLMISEAHEEEENTRAHFENGTNTKRGNAHLSLKGQGNVLEAGKQDKDRPKRNLTDVRTRFYAPRPESCRRQIPIPRRMFLYCNRKRRINVLKYIKKNETEKTRLLLNEHIMRSVYYHKIDNEKSQKREQVGGFLEKPKEKKEETVISTPSAPKITTDNGASKSVANEVVDLLDDEEDISNLEKSDSKDSKNAATSSPASIQTFKTGIDNQPQNINQEGVITMKTFGSLSGVNVANVKDTSNAPGKVEELKLPKISNCFSLNAKANLRKPFTPTVEKISAQQQHMADFTSAATVYSPAFNSSRSRNVQQHLHTDNAATFSSGVQMPFSFENDNVRDVYNNVIRTMNSLVSKKMQDVDFALKRDSHIIPTPNADILCMMKWSNFLEAFCQGFAFIWQVKSREGTYLVATIRNMLPMISDAMGVVNITALKPDRLPLMGKMLLQNVRNEHTAKLAIVMQGKMSYWIVKGFLRAEPSTACNKPTPETHPSLTKKINVLCTSLVKQRQKDEKNKEMQAQKWSGSAAPPSKSAKVAQIMPTPRNTAVVEPQISQMQLPQPTAILSVTAIQQPPQQQQHIMSQGNSFASPVPTSNSNQSNATQNPAQKVNNTQNSRKRKTAGDSSVNGNISPKVDAYAQMSTNIEFRKVTREDIDEIHLPEIHKNNHKWLVLDLHNDFSHIFVPDFRDLVSLDRIQKVINFAMQKNKIVKLQFFQNAPFDAFVTPKSGRKIYFGPLDMNMKPPTLILLQSVDGQMMLRELYQLKHGIQKSLEERTKAFWLLQMNGQTHFEVDVVTTKDVANNLAPVVPIARSALPVEQPESVDKTMAPNANSGDDDDEDCMIIDDGDGANPTNNSQQEERYNFTIGSTPNDNNSISIIPQTNSLPGPPPIQTLITTMPAALAKECVTTPTSSSSSSLLKIPNTNTVIKSVLQMPLVQASSPVLSLPSSTLITGITTTATATYSSNPNSILNLPSNAIITGITPAPQEASYGSTIFISSPANGNTQIPLTNTSDHSVGKSKKPLAQVPPEVITISDNASQCGTIAEKRRRISLVCHNTYDINSQNIAVNAVINKILPDNVEDIQVNQPAEVTRQNATAGASTIGSTTITKITESSSYRNHKKPVVFDVSFVDGMDEPAASIVIKPTTSTKSNETIVNTAPSSSNDSATSSTATVTAVTTISATETAPSTSSTTTLHSVVTQTSKVNSVAATHIQKFNIKNTNNKHIGYKVVRLPTSSLTSALSGGAGQPQILSRLLCTSSSTVPTSTITASTASTCPQKNLTKTVLNTTNPIKITSITPNPTTKATIKPLEQVPTSVTITTVTKSIQPKQTVSQPKDAAKTTVATLPSRTVTIRQILPKPTAAEVLPTTPPQTAVTYKQPTLPVSTMATITTTSSICTLSSSNSVVSTVASTITAIATGTSVNTLSPPLAITNVQTLGKGVDTPTSASLSLPAHIQYGYIVSPVYTDLKFVAKRIMDEFYVKVPSVGILKLKGMGAVDNYLNKHKLKTSDKNTGILPGNWYFAAASKAIQMQNHQKSLLVRKAKPGLNKLPTCINTPKSDCSKTQKVVNVTSMSEPILIDD